MKSALFALICFLASTLGVRAGTAYAALELVGKQHGEKILDQIMEVRGVSGAPQPKEWIICVVDKDARGGVREFGVQGTKITSERTPVGRGVTAPMNMNQLNLDSDGAQTVADREAKKAGFEYDYADYVLHAGTRGGTPVWELNLVDEKSGSVATLLLAADKGTILSAEGLDKARPVPPAPEEDPRRQASGDPRQARPSARGNFFQRAGDSMNHFFDRVGNHLERRGRQIGDTFHNAFTGDRRHSAGPHHLDDEEPAPVAGPAPSAPPPRTYRDPNGTENTRPRD
jgi:hypothetical protein